jgi:hypothetical protein
MWERLFPFGLTNEIRFWFIRTFKTRNCIKPSKEWTLTYSFNESGEDNAAERKAD